MICMNFAENDLFASFGVIADSKLLDFSDHGQLTLRISRMLGVLCYTRHRPNSYTHARVLRRRGLGIALPYGSSSEACIIIEFAIFRGLSSDDASVSVEESNHASMPPVKQYPKC